MALLIDTTVLIELERGALAPARQEAIRNATVAVSVITVSELLHGVHRAADDRRARRRTIVERLLRSFTPLPVDADVARVYAEIWAELESRGEVINSHDLWIAATAIVHDLEILTLDLRDFRRVAGLRVALP